MHAMTYISRLKEQADEGLVSCADVIKAAGDRFLTGPARDYGYFAVAIIQVALPLAQADDDDRAAQVLALLEARS